MDTLVSNQNNTMLSSEINAEPSSETELDYEADDFFDLDSSLGSAEENKTNERNDNKRRKIEPVNSIFVAYNARNWDTIEAILAVEPLAVNDCNEFGQSLLMLEVLNADRIRYLLEIGADPHLRCNKGYNALFYAAKKRAPVEVFKLLLEHKIEPNCANKHGTTTLIYTVENYKQGDEEKIRLLLEADGVDVTTEDSLGRSALMLASVRHAQNQDLNKLLLDAMVRKFYNKVQKP
jgi:ankyrin repeat protein